jgi:putative ABC transport system permease protein
VFSISLPNARYPQQTRQHAAFQQMETSVAAIPGVEAVGRAQVAPIYGGGWSWTAFREGSDGHDGGAVGADMRTVSAGYFAALRLPIVRGRSFTPGDVADGPPVAIVSRGLARKLFGAADPIGRRISNGDANKPRWREIVGVVDDMHADGLVLEPPLELYMPSTQWVNPGQTFVIRGHGDVTALLPSVRRSVASVDPLLGGTGLLLAAIGVYGVIAYVVQQRSHELGVRMALGATAGAVQAMMLRQGFILAATGVGAGLVVSYGASLAIRGLMFGVTPHDPVTFVTVAGVLLAVALASTFIPARRATRIDPLEALRGSRG